MIKEKEIEIDGLKINYKIGGEGFPFLILHGWGGSCDSWKKVIEILEKEFKIACLDFPGFGKSSFPPAAWSLNDFSNLVKKFTEKIGFEEFFLLGHSFGGRVAIKFVNFFPEKVKKLILISSAGIKPTLNLKTKIIFWLANWGNCIFSLRPFSQFKESARKIFYFFLRGKDYVKARGVMRETMKKILAEDLSPFLSQIKKETILIWGERDRVVPLKYGMIFKEKIENSKLIVLPKLGHSPHLENPQKLAEILIEQLKS